MQPENTVLFSDLDGTLFSSRGEISRENREAIAEYTARGGRFAVSTGRQPDNALGYLPGVIVNAPCVVLNGAAVYDFAAGRYDHCFFISREELDPILCRAMEATPHLDLQIYTPGGIFYVTPESTAQPQMLALHRPCSFVSWESLAGEPVFKCLLYAPPREDSGLREILEGGEEGVYRLVPGTTDVGGRISYYELMPREASKGSALTLLRSHPDLAGRRFLAVGDFWNDYEMLLAADVPIAPANAVQGIRDICAHVTASNNDHAIAHIIREIIPSL